jgi:hypothetical protein
MPPSRGSSLSRRIVVPSLAAIGLALVAFAGGRPVAVSSARAAICSAYSNQAAAQRARDTRDADGDGMYCESLPCPCLKPAQASGAGHGGKKARASRRGAGAVRRPRLGRSVRLGPERRRSGCRARGPLPDPGCTPGARFARATRSMICRPGYAREVRHVSAATKDAVYAAYGMTRHFDGADGEVDHLVSLELGGSNSRANLFPEPARPRPGSHEKDRLENRLHDEVCSGRISLRRAQRLIAAGWVAAYRARFG